MTCPRCGQQAVPVEEDGRWGPHRRRALCGVCGAFLQWMKYGGVAMTSLNLVALIGEVAREPRADAGATVSTRVCIRETHDGRAFHLYVGVQALGKAAEVLRTLREGDALLLKGKLAWRKEAEGKGEVTVVTWDLQALPGGLGAPAADAAAASRN